MTSARRGRVLPLVLALVVVPAAVAWLAASVVHLVRSDTAYHVRVVDPPAGSPPLPPAIVDRLQADQNRWGVQAMFAVAAVAASLVLTLVAWLLTWQRDNARRRR